MFKIAVTGHRMNRISNDTEVALVGLVVECLSRIKVSCIEPIQVLSALAEGADRIVVEAALQIGVPFSVVLPFPPNTYEADFETSASKERFYFLLKHAQTVEFLSERPRSARSQGYRSVGDALLKNIDALIAIWDGEPARGKGGTAEVVQKALDAGVPVLWLYPHRNSNVRLIRKHAGDKYMTVYDRGLDEFLAILPASSS